MCSVSEIHCGGFYSWLKQPLTRRDIEDARLLNKIKQFWLDSGCVYGYRNITIDLKQDGETSGKHRVRRIMSKHGITAIRGYKRHPGFKNSRQHIAASNILNREFQVTEPNHWWASDITYIKTQDDFLFLAVVMDLLSRKIQASL